MAATPSHPPFAACFDRRSRSTPFPLFCGSPPFSRSHQTTLKPFAPFLLSILDSLTTLTESQVRRLFVILFAVHDDEDGANIHIVIRKYLSHSSMAMKQIGIIGATAFAVTKSLKLRGDFSTSGPRAAREAEGESGPETQAPHSTSAQEATFKEIEEVMQLAHTSCSSAGPTAHTAVGFLYDELALAIKGNQVAPTVKGWILDKYSNLLEKEFMGEVSEE